MSATDEIPSIKHVFKGTFVHSTWNSPMEILENRVLGVGSSGKIEFLEEEKQQEKLAEKWGFNVLDIKQLNNNEFLMPGMVDTHIHAPQYSFAGSALDKQLLGWLMDYKFPMEMKFNNEEFARNVYTKVVRRTLRNGTTTACYFPTIHTDTSLILADIANLFGQRAFVGKVCTDRNEMYPEYKEDTYTCIIETKRFLDALLNRKYPRVKPILTPSSAMSCTEELMSELSNLAVSRDLHIQGHISETKEGIEAVKAMSAHQENEFSLYERNKLLTPKTVMAHGCHLSDEELDMFKVHGAAISHCPNSNISLRSGHLDVRNALKRKVKIGLGTDVAGGYSASILDAFRRAMDTSKMLFIQDPTVEVLTYQEVFRLATLGGSQALALDDVIGNFEVGKEFDALLINPGAEGSPFEIFANCTEDVIQKFLYLGDDRNIKEVYVAGRNLSLTN
ncbi:guanine deaminase-like isoform X2 [Ambystoma mexicanum]|uniref:guanine deaminase-like isoform X2 n=1 Tax=Ambystoma mexicanum TaxID=8296 RepID=UPI0037E7CEDB